MLGIYSKRAKIYRAAGRVGMLEINSKRANMINLNEGLVDHRRPCYHIYIYVCVCVSFGLSFGHLKCWRLDIALP